MSLSAHLPAAPAAELPARGLRVLVLTVVHHSEDARILHREIAALIEAGAHVTYAAPFSAYGVPAPAGLDTIDLPRALGRRRGRAALAAGRVLLTRSGR